MTSKERFLRMYAHQEADRVPIIDSPWAGTIARWKQEGMPADVDWRDFFDVDKCESIGVDITPRYEQKILEETDRYIIHTTPWGVTLKQFKELDSTPEFLDFTVTTEEAWAEAKKTNGYFSRPGRLGLFKAKLRQVGCRRPVYSGRLLVWL